MAAEHHYVVTEPVARTQRQDWPILRDPDRWAYLKPEAGGSCLVGLFEPVGRPWPPPRARLRPTRLVHHDGPRRRPPVDLAGPRLRSDPGPARDRPAAAVRRARERSRRTTPTSWVRRPGERPGLFVAAGFNSIGIQSAGGAGMAISPLDRARRAPLRPARRRHPSLRAVPEQRVVPAEADHRGPRSAVRLPPSAPDFETARGIRRTRCTTAWPSVAPASPRLNGWERPAFYARPEHRGRGRAPRRLGHRPRGCRPTVWSTGRCGRRSGVFDLTSFAKFSVAGAVTPRAVLDVLSAGDVNGEVGRSVYTQWCNDVGGIEADLTVSRIAEDRVPGHRRRRHPSSRPRHPRAGLCRAATPRSPT